MRNADDDVRAGMPYSARNYTPAGGVGANRFLEPPGQAVIEHPRDAVGREVHGADRAPQT